MILDVVSSSTDLSRVDQLLSQWQQPSCFSIWAMPRALVGLVYFARSTRLTSHDDNMVSYDQQPGWLPLSTRGQGSTMGTPTWPIRGQSAPIYEAWRSQWGTFNHCLTTIEPPINPCLRASNHVQSSIIKWVTMFSTTEPLFYHYFIMFNQFCSPGYHSPVQLATR